MTLTARSLRLILLAVAIATCLAPFGEARAQSGLFSTVAKVNDRAITAYQLSERTRFLTLLGVPERAEELALEQLTNEALQIGAATAAGVFPTPQAVAEGQAEFAGRANLTVEQFTAALTQAGVGLETFRDFIVAGVTWRDYVQQRFREQAEDIPDSQLQRATESASFAGGERILITEILLPADTPEAEAVSRTRALELRGSTAEEFSLAARRFSVAGSRFRGGELDWQPIETLPEPVGAALSAVRIGQVSGPVALDGAVGVYYVRDRETVPPTGPGTETIELARVRLSASDTRGAAAFSESVETCDEFEAEARRSGGEALRETTLVRALAPAIAAEVEDLDRHEISTDLVVGSERVLVMVCARALGESVETIASQIRLAVFNNRLRAFAGAHLAELRARAVITGPAN